MGRKKREIHIFYEHLWLLWTFTVCVTGCGSKLEGPGSWPEETEREREREKGHKGHGGTAVC
ncbi:Uncharacterized protein APZ42_016209 [Daphnia magna]|uniref:Uncharacterized protein n=1 Tax=Daphnia magna TaxID=35525 RepID=A0A165AJA7_9CRUS|nr:Uncharacterized protein APZ42_016209 [Daphnia magna]